MRSVDGSMLTVATGGIIMGQALPAQSQQVDAALLTPERAGEMIQQALAGSPALGTGTGGDPGSTRKIDDTQCAVGRETVACGLYELTRNGTTGRIWHAPSLPPVFMGGIVRAEATIQGRTVVIRLQGYRGSLLR